jgi:hypothetical protein
MHSYRELLQKYFTGHDRVRTTIHILSSYCNFPHMEHQQRFNVTNGRRIVLMYSAGDLVPTIHSSLRYVTSCDADRFRLEFGPDEQNRKWGGAFSDDIVIYRQRPSDVPWNAYTIPCSPSLTFHPIFCTLNDTWLCGGRNHEEPSIRRRIFHWNSEYSTAGISEKFRIAAGGGLTETTASPIVNSQQYDYGVELRNMPPPMTVIEEADEGVSITELKYVRCTDSRRHHESFT